MQLKIKQKFWWRHSHVELFVANQSVCSSPFFLCLTFLFQEIYNTWSAFLWVCAWLLPPIMEKMSMCPSKPAADSTAGFLGHHWISKHHWLLVGNSYSTWRFKQIIYPHQRDKCSFSTFVESICNQLLPLLCLDSSTRSCCPSRSSGAAQDQPSSRRWQGHPCSWKQYAYVLKSHANLTDKGWQLYSFIIANRPNEKKMKITAPQYSSQMFLASSASLWLSTSSLLVQTEDLSIYERSQISF